jgi:signal transduction histidine kinase
MNSWRSPSLRGSLTLIAVTVVVLLTTTLLLLIWVLRSSQADLVARSNKHLQAVAHSLAEAYQNRTDREVTLARAGPPMPRPPSPMGLPPPPPVPPPAPPQLMDRSLALLTASILRDETGIEGGYFRSTDHRLVGYAFPTHEGPGDPSALPGRETPSIVNVALEAISQNQVRQESFYGPHDVVLFTAIPVCDASNCEGGPTGAAWLMQRMAGVESERKRALLWSAFGFGAVACITVIVALLVLTQVDRGTQAVLDRLTHMGSDLSQQDRPPAVQLAEFHRVMDGLDRLGETLRAQIARERDLQNRLRQNERLAAMGQVTAGVAHELRNPLATIRLRSQMAQRRTSDGAVAQAASVILAEVDRLDGIIERLLNFSRAIRLNLASVDLSRLCHAAAARWRTRSPGIEFFFAGEESVSATADPDRLEQVVDNVIDNAVNQFSEAKTIHPAVTLACSRSGEDITLEIRDNGGGFSPEALESATEPFFTTHAKGTGLGLSITREIVTALGGTLSLHNENGGAAVRVRLPVRAAEGGG